MLAYLFFSSRKEYNLLEDLEGVYVAYWKEKKTASEVKSGRGKMGEDQEEQAPPTGWDPSRWGISIASYKKKHLFLKPLNNQIPCFPLIYHSSVY